MLQNKFQKLLSSMKIPHVLCHIARLQPKVAAIDRAQDTFPVNVGLVIAEPMSRAKDGETVVDVAHVLIPRVIVGGGPILVVADLWRWFLFVVLVFLTNFFVQEQTCFEHNLAAWFTGFFQFIVHHLLVCH